MVLAAIRSNPVTAPYPISTSMQKGKVVLSGIVGTKQVHDAAVRMVIDMGVPVRDDLVIDTGAAAAVAHAAGAAVGGYGGAMPGTLSNSSPYIYPPPLFGRLDDPFFGYVPPLVSFPPWWPARVKAARNGSAAARSSRSATADIRHARRFLAPKRQSQGNVATAGGRPGHRACRGEYRRAGGVFLRGVVASEQAAREIEDSVRTIPGVTSVSSQFQTVPRRAD